MACKRSVVTLAAALFLVASVSPEAGAWGRNRHNRPRVKNIIVLIPDGCSQSIQTLTRWYKGAPLTLDSMNVGVAMHHMADSVITDSASAATAFSTGFKTSNGFLSVGPRADTVLTGFQWPAPPEYLSYRPLATVLEGAKLKGKATGLVSTSRFTHATPAAWACHTPNRNDEDTVISEHMVYNDVDLVFGGGERTLTSSRRPDKEDLLQVLVDRGYEIVRTRTEMDGVFQLPVFGVFASSHMAPEIDRPLYSPEEPSLADMTAKAIELLSQDEDGFFLMVEASQVDWAGHGNDPIYMVTDFLEFDEAVTVAVDFARRDGDTLVVAYPDHNTGGLSIGNRETNGTYTHLTVEELVGPLKGMTRTALALLGEINALGGPTVDNIKDAVLEHWGLDISEDVAQEIIDLTRSPEGEGGYMVSYDYALARVISEHYTAIGWTSHGHNAEDVPVWAYGPGAPSGLVDNTELATLVADLFDLNMEALNRWLFVDLDEAFPGRWTLDTTDPANPVARVGGWWARAELPCSKDLLTITRLGHSKTYNLSGLAVYAPDTGRVYVPQGAVSLMRRSGIW